MQGAILMLALAAAAQTWDFKTGPKPNVSLANVDGSITVQGSARDDVAVEATDAKVHLSTVSGKLNGQKIGMGSGDKMFGKGTVAVRVKTVSGSVDAQPSP